ncbi:ABC transporter ATP-binding protein [Labrys neptuniae]
MATVDLEKVCKRFGSLEVVHAVDLSIAEGEFVVLVGPSGCGKSTLLRMVAGLEKMSGGHIRIGADAVDHLPPRDRDIAMVFQNYALYPHMTVAANMGFGLRLRKTPRTEIDKRVATAAAILGLEDLLDRHPRALSGGQRQRVAMGRAIVRDPQVFLFDEPLSNLDAKLRVQMRTEIKALQKRLGTTSIYVTHDQVEAMTMADRIVVMRQGRIEQIGAPLALYEKPANLFVAGFIGSPSMNFVQGVLGSEKGRRALRTDDGVVLPLPQACPGEDGHRVVCGIRPEHLTVCGEGDADAFAIELNLIEPTGSQTFAFAEAGAQKLCLIAADPRALPPGGRVHVKADPSRIHIFDADSGAVLQ